MRFSIYTILITALINSCGKKKDSDDDSPSPGSDNQNPIISLTQLPSDLKAKIEKWQQSIVKTCDGAVENTPKMDAGIDLKSLTKKYGNNALLSDENGNLMLIDGFNSFAHTSTGKSEFSVSINGSGYKLRSEWNNEKCKLFVNDGLVYETDIMPSIRVAAFSSKTLKPTKHQVEFPSITNKNRIEIPALSSLSLQHHSNNPETLTKVVESLLAYDSKKDTKILDASKNFRLDHSISLLQSTAAIFNQNYPAVFNDFNGAEIRKKLNDKTWIVKYDFNEANASRNLFELKNKNAIHQIEYTLSEVNVNNNGAASTIDFVISKVEYKGSKQPSLIDAQNCANDTRSKIAAESLFFPSFASFSDVCKTYHPHIIDILDHSDIGRLLNPWNRYDQVGSLDISYNGWDGVLVEKILALRKQNDDTLDYLSKLGRSPIIASLQTELKRFDGSVKNYQNLISKQDDLLKKLILRWPFLGIEVSDAYIENILVASNRAINELPTSTDNLLIDLVRSPENQKSFVEFAMQITDGDLKLIRETHQAAKDANAEDAFVQKHLNSYIQNQIPASKNFAKIRENLNALKEFYNQDKALAGTFYDSEYKNFAKSYVNNSWTSNDLVQIKSLASTAKLKISCERHKAIVQQAECIGSSSVLFATGEKSYLNAKYDGRYSQFANQLLSAVNMENFQKRSGYSVVVDAFFDGLWLNCSNSDFNQKQQQLFATLKDFTQQTEFSEEIKIKRLLEDAVDSKCP